MVKKENKPSHARIIIWYKDTFPNKDIDFEIKCGNIAKWENRFETPQSIWGMTDGVSKRKKLVEHFPLTFKGLKGTENLYDEEFGDKYKKW